jgi:hypothetical protein
LRSWRIKECFQPHGQKHPYIVKRIGTLVGRLYNPEAMAGLDQLGKDRFVAAHGGKYLVEKAAWWASRGTGDDLYGRGLCLAEQRWLSQCQQRRIAVHQRYKISGTGPKPIFGHRPIGPVADRPIVLLQRIQFGL